MCFESDKILIYIILFAKLHPRCIEHNLNLPIKFTQKKTCPLNKIK